MRVNDDGRTIAAMDVLAPGIGEIIGGSQREERLEALDRSMAEHGIDWEHYAPTLSLRRKRGEGREGVICTAMARCRTRASASSAPSPTSPAFPMCATLCSREHPETGGSAGSTTTRLSSSHCMMTALSECEIIEWSWRRLIST